MLYLTRVIFTFLVGFYFIAYSATLEKPLTVVITSFNNKLWYPHNLTSVFNQIYTNYRVIYIDDCSTDNTGDLVEQYINQCNQGHRVTLIKNKQWLSQMANHYKAIQMCKDSEIVMHLDGDDWLAHPEVLKRVNEIYSHEDIWLTYGQYQFWPSNIIGSSGPVPAEIRASGNYRQAPWLFMHLRTFYAWLFKKLKLEDLLFEGSFKASAPAPDSIFMYPMLEMAHMRALFVPEILYIYNLKNPLSQFVLNPNSQLRINNTARSWPPYKALQTNQADFMNAYAHKTADLVIISQNLPDTLEQLLKLRESINSIRNTIVIYEANDGALKRAYEKLRKNFLSVKFFYYTPNQGTFKVLFEYIMRNLVGDYVVLTKDHYYPQAAIDIGHSIRLLERTQAHGFYFGISPNEYNNGLEVFVDLFDQESAWQFKYNKNIWKEAYSLRFVLYRKQELYQKILSLNYMTISEFVNLFYLLNNDEKSVDRKVGLFLKKPRTRQITY